MVKSLLSLFICLFLWIPEAHAVRMTGGQLASFCQGELREGEKVSGAEAACKAYILGIIDYHTMFQSVNMTPGVNFCVPQNVSDEQVRQIVQYYLKKNPHHGEFLASPSVALALAEVFPCQKS